MTKIISQVLRSVVPSAAPKVQVPAPVALSPQQLGMVTGGAPTAGWKAK